MCSLSTGRRFSSRRTGAGTGAGRGNRDRAREQGAAREKENGRAAAGEDGATRLTASLRGKRRRRNDAGKRTMGAGLGRARPPWRQGRPGAGDFFGGGRAKAGSGPGLTGAEPDRERRRCGGCAGNVRNSAARCRDRRNQGQGKSTGAKLGRRAREQGAGTGRGTEAVDRRMTAEEAGRFRSEAGRKPERLCPVAEKVGEFAKKCLPRQAVFYTRTAVPRWWNW